MLLVDDLAQDIFGRKDNWTDEKKTGSGLAKPTKLKCSYRLPAPLIEQASYFAERYLTAEPDDLPVAPPGQADFVTKLRWVQTDLDDASELVTEEVCKLAASATGLGMTEITVLTTDVHTGVGVVWCLRESDIECVTTFSMDDDGPDPGREDTRLKRAFFLGNPRLKVTTVHSFKGWESRAIVLHLRHQADEEGLALAYTGLTRLKRSDHGSFMTVVCAMDALADYGKGWPEFEDSRFM